ncbi:hypothetical protein GCM10010124_29250 [Pilimelia terevasa]|uniref:Uncharacterized protein n=1 Tax=Pilimelia terevasa TaxID=53372 RepID=A0A8J3BTK9_9ACTN|nr:DUF4254 domain-containing protein [Pilimelia terevasa]GGK34757.1 hypothetical protein GCM10010124_29250 [Pilimelia terevasa]
MIPTQPARPYDIVAGLAAEFDLGRHLLADLNTVHRRQWRLEDASRDRDAAPERLAVLKAEIDSSNARRHRLITAIDTRVDYRPGDGASRYYSETIGELCDRLIILDLKHEAVAATDPGHLAALSSHLAETANQLIAHARRGVAVLPPRVGIKVYRRADQADLPRQRRRLRALVTSTRRSQP